MREFKARALLWVEYSNKKLLTDEEQALVDKVPVLFSVLNFFYDLLQVADEVSHHQVEAGGDATAITSAQIEAHKAYLEKEFTTKTGE